MKLPPQQEQQSKGTMSVKTQQKDMTSFHGSLFITAVHLLESFRGSGRTAAGKYTFSIEKCGKNLLPLFHDQLF